MRTKGITVQYSDAWIQSYTEGKSIREIADEYGVSKSVISRAIKPFIKIRPKSPNEKYGEEWLNLYIEGVSKTEIARRYDVFPGIVGNVLEKMGVQKTERKRKYEHLSDDFSRLYMDGKSLREIGEIYGINPQTILEYIKRDSVPVRSISEASRTIEFDEGYFDKLTDDNIFVLGMIFRIGHIIMDNGIPRAVKIVSKNKEFMDFIMDKLGREGDERLGKQDGIYYFDEIHSLKFVSRLYELGLNTKNSYQFPTLKQEKLNILIDGLFYPKILECKGERTISFAFPSREIKEVCLAYFEQKGLFSKNDIRGETDRKFIIGKKSCISALKEYYASLL